ncbi:MAG: YkgJ family cysteine cluster protein [Moorellaceae bacterium]
MPPVQVRPWYVNGKGGYDVIVTSDEATLNDYLLALEQVESFNIYRSFRAGGRSCQGCSGCCRDRLPLTLRDVINLREGLQALTGKSMALKDIIADYCRIQKMGRALDITLRTDGEGYCLFLSPENNLCRIYAYRPLVCRTYYCCPATRRALELRSSVVNRGEDELAYYWSTGKLKFPQIYLKHICSPLLWEKLTRG